MILAAVLYACSFIIAFAMVMQVRTVYAHLDDRVPLHFGLTGKPGTFASARAIWTYPSLAFGFSVVYVLLGLAVSAASSAHDEHPYRGLVAWAFFSIGICALLAVAQNAAIAVALGKPRRINVGAVWGILTLTVLALVGEFATGFGG